MICRGPDRWSHGLLAACYAQMGRLDEARSESDAFVSKRQRELREQGEAPVRSRLDFALPLNFLRKRFRPDIGDNDVTALRTDGNQRYSCTKNRRSLFVKATRPRTLRCNTIS